jgi:uncharacterized surface protein with fasciclin (FAS1) repeats
MNYHTYKTQHKIRRHIMKNLRTYSVALFIGLFAFVLVGCSDDDSSSSPSSPDTGQSDIVDTAIAAGSFNTLVAAVQAAGLEETLRSPGPFTVFAPTDDAFAKLPAGTVEDLLKPENLATLQSILLFHVAPGSFKAADALAQSPLTSAQGGLLYVSIDGDGPEVNDSKITQTDIAASNGVIHVIDTVLIPAN